MCPTRKRETLLSIQRWEREESHESPGSIPSSSLKKREVGAQCSSFRPTGKVIQRISVYVHKYTSPPAHPQVPRKILKDPKRRSCWGGAHPLYQLGTRRRKSLFRSVANSTCRIPSKENRRRGGTCYSFPFF